MTYYYFQKINIKDWGSNSDWLVIFKQGEIGNPVCILDRDSIKRLIEEWNETEEKKA